MTLRSMSARVECTDHSDADVCEECCEHMDRDGYECLDYGMELHEFLAGQAEDYYEGDR